MSKKIPKNAKNLFCKGQKTSTKAYRKGWERVFGSSSRASISNILITCKNLKDAFPEYLNKIEYAENHNICPCAGCVSYALEAEIGFNLLQELSKRKGYTEHITIG